MPEHDVGARLEWIEAELEIHRLASEYCIGADTRDLGMWSEVWTEDATWTVSDTQVFTGRDAICAAVDVQWRAFRRMQHTVSNHVVSIDGDEATGRADVTVFVQLDETRWITGGGTYHDRYRRDDGRWRIAERRVTDGFHLELPPSTGTDVQA